MDVMGDGFRKVTIDTRGLNLFEELVGAVQWEHLGKGREGAIIVNYADDEGVPIVRTTTCYENAAQRWKAVHKMLVERIAAEVMGGGARFNNASLEIYDSSYRKMGYHTDASLDLAADTWICLFTVYEDPMTQSGIRTLCTLKKSTQAALDITLDHNSAVLFSTSTNHAHLHKIVALSPPKPTESRWLGVTLRWSKRRIQFGLDGVPRFQDNPGRVLTLASPGERGLFIRCKGDENKTDGVYQWDDNGITFTISKSDLMEPLV